MSRLRRLSNFRLWLTPGMGVKRHVARAVLGAVILLVGVIAGTLWLLEEVRGQIAAPIEAWLVSAAWRQSGGWVAALVALVGLAISVSAVGRLNRSLLSHWLPKPDEAAAVLHRRLSLARGPRVVAIGGGTGLSNLLRGLRLQTSNITAVVTVSDDGGSSGRLRSAFGMPAPGDLSDCLAALSDNELQVSRLLEYRFTRGAELEGHTFGNLLITTLTEVEGDFAQAARVLNSLLNICGAVYPVTTEPVSLEVIKRSGERVHGESQVRAVPGPAARALIRPSEPAVVPEVVAAIETAELVVLGPGSLFTSPLPPLLVPGCRRALLMTNAKLVYVCNVMTEAGETDGFSAWNHVAAIHQHLGRYPDVVAINTTPVDEARLERYRTEQAEVVSWNEADFARAKIDLVTLQLLGPGPWAQHDPYKLAEWLASYAKTAKYRPNPSLEPV